MRHNWQLPEALVGEVLLGSQRKCLNCGAVQKRRALYRWGKVAGYRWSPRAGRCKAPEGKPLIDLLG